MLALHLEGRSAVAASLEIGLIAEGLEGYSASDIRFLVDEAARAAFANKQDITEDSFRIAKVGVQPSVTSEVEAQYQSLKQRGILMRDVRSRRMFKCAWCCCGT